VSGSALSGVRVLDFTWVGAGSFTTKLLADHGADVIKIESRSHLDSLRTGPPFAGGVRGINRSGYFAERNTSKRSVCLDLQTDAGRDLARQMVARCDVIANNFRPGVMERFGLGYAALRAEHPELIYLSMSMQGTDGPDRDYLGYGLTIGALVGLHELTGLPDRYPCGTGTNYPDHVPNPGHAALAVLAALRHRRRTGEGQLIDIAQTEPTIASIGSALVQFTLGGEPPQRSGNRHPAYAPHGVYPCAGDDRWIAIAVADDHHWHELCDELGELAQPGLAHAEQRRDRAAELDALIAERTRGWDRWELMERLQRRGVAAGVMEDAADLLERDPQLAHRGHWQTLSHPEMGDCVYGSPPFRMGLTPGRLRSPAPLLGQHTEAVLKELLELDEDEIAELNAQDVLR
jgi:benzylsuccinate CoA-transferase BbsF subunit